MTSTLDLAKSQATHACDALYDTLWKALYLNELSQRMELSEVAVKVMEGARREVMEAVGGSCG